jgi:hypothetical protein
VGLRIDHDEISAGGKSLMMVTALGTAVTLRPLAHHDEQRQEDDRLVSSHDLSTIIERELLLERLSPSREIDDDTWRFLAENRVWEAAPLVL